jgi:hypothetical protein
MQHSRGRGGGKTESLDRVTLTSRCLGLTGRPDRLITANRSIIVEEWKSGRRVRDAHWAQMGCYFLLVEAECGFARRMASSSWATARGIGSRTARA